MIVSSIIALVSVGIIFITMLMLAYIMHCFSEDMSKIPLVRGNPRISEAATGHGITKDPVRDLSGEAPYNWFYNWFEKFPVSGIGGGCLPPATLGR